MATACLNLCTWEPPSGASVRRCLFAVGVLVHAMATTSCIIFASRACILSYLAMCSLLGAHDVQMIFLYHGPCTSTLGVIPSNASLKCPSFSHTRPRSHVSPSYESPLVCQDE